MAEQTWFDILRELMCRLYQEMGGSCLDLFPPGVPPVVADAVDLLTKGGVPKSPSESLVGVAAETEDHLDGKGNDLDEKVNLALLGFVQAVQQAAG
jgi:hypothetical protein